MVGAVTQYFALQFAPLVDDCHTGTGHAETAMQIFRAQHIVEVGNGIESLFVKHGIETLQTQQTFVVGKVDSLYLNIRWYPLEKG